MKGKTSFVPYRLFSPEMWLKGDGSKVKTIGFIGRCTDLLGPEVSCVLFGVPATNWYLSSGRNLLFLTEHCCLEEIMGEGAKHVVGAFPIEGDWICDLYGRPWPLQDVIEAVKRGASVPAPEGAVTAEGKHYYYLDTPCDIDSHYYWDYSAEMADTGIDERDASISPEADAPTLF